jgi:general secretion pathway protein M
MIELASLRARLTSVPFLCAALYAATVIVCAWVTIGAIADVLESRRELVGASALLEKFQARGLPSRSTGHATAPAPVNSPLVEGTTISVARAALLQRVDAAVAQSGGNVLSSQVESASGRSDSGTIDALIACDIDSNGLQKLLYNLEAGMPFLFIDQLTIQTQSRSTGAAGEKLHVSFGVSGQWEGAK